MSPPYVVVHLRSGPSETFEKPIAVVVDEVHVFVMDSGGVRHTWPIAVIQKVVEAAAA